jgi:hypothetical protein
MSVLHLLGARANKPVASAAKSDISAMWESKSLTVLSQPSTPISEVKRPNILTLIKESKSQTPKKRLYCPPLTVCPEETKTFGKASKGPDFMYSMVSFTSDDELELPEGLSSLHTYVFKGGEKDVQIIAWENFKSNLNSGGLFTIEFKNAVFLVNDGVIKVKALTGIARQCLSALTDDIENMSIADVINFVEKDIFEGKERLNLCSSLDFYYATNIPISVSHASFCGAKGRKFRVLIKGHVFASLVKNISENAVMSTSTIY